MAKGRAKLRARAAQLSGKELLSGPTRSANGVTKSKVGPKGKRKRGRERLERQRLFVARELERRGLHDDGEKAPGLSLTALGHALAKAAASDPSVPTVAGVRGGTSARARKHRVREETAQMASVSAHPAFQADPVEALRQHLLNTVCGAPEKVPPALAGDAPGAAKKAKGGAADGEKKKKKARTTVAPALEASKEALAQAREEAKDRVREKRERKADMERAAAALRKKGRGVEKTRTSPQTRGRIGVKRPKILDE